jgi:hypothetical protein
MIQKISINNFGSLINFSNDQCKFVKGKTVIHGMNGSGKSQICSIFHQVEKMKNIKTLEPNKKRDEEKNILNYIRSRISKEATSAIVDIKIDNYTLSIDTGKNMITENGDTPDIFIFNEDYVNENIGDFLNIHDREIRIGQKNKERDNLITEKQNNEKALEKVNEEIEKIVKKAKEESGYPKQVRTDKIISRENYLLMNNPCESYPNGKKELSALSDPPDKIIDHLNYSFPLLLLEDTTKSSITEIMLKSYIEPKLTKEFYKTYLTIKKSFYEDGVSLFKEQKNICPFCLTPKDENDPIIQELISYIDSDFNNKLNKIQKILDFFVQKKKELEVFLSAWNAILPIVRDKSKDLSITEKVDDIIIDEIKFNDCIDLLKKNVKEWMR